MLYPRPNPKLIYAALGDGDLSETMRQLESVWRKFLPDRPFEYEFLSDRFDGFYRSEMTLRKVFTLFSALAVVVGCLGTLGLVSYTAQRRRREMSIRRVLGAGSGAVVALLASEFLVLVGASFVLAAPIAYHFCGNWLNGFTYRIGLPVSAFLLGALATLVLVALSVASRALRTANEDPVDALRCE